MDDRVIDLLLLEDNPGDARLIQEALLAAGTGSFRIEHADSLAAGLARLTSRDFDAILLDLWLPDDQGLDVFVQVHTHAPDKPILVLADGYEEVLALRVMRAGAQDYLVKGQVDRHMLARAIRYAIERQRLQTILHSQSLIDDLTGLYNRRGFLTMADQYWKLARRGRRSFLLAFGDMDGLKQINDTFGHAEGDHALRKIAEILRQTFRASDIVARLGGDEFTVLVIDAVEGDADRIMKRLRETLNAHNARANHERGYHLGLSLGFVRFDPAHTSSIEELMARADRVLYEHKHGRRRTPVTGDLPPLTAPEAPHFPARGGDARTERGEAGDPGSKSPHKTTRAEK